MAYKKSFQKTPLNPTSSTTVSGKAPWSVAMTGVPDIKLSITIYPKGSGYKVNENKALALAISSAFLSPQTGPTYSTPSFIYFSPGPGPAIFRLNFNLF